MEDSNGNSISAAIEAGKALGSHQTMMTAPNGDQLHVIHQDFKVERVPALNKRLPDHIMCREMLIDLGSFSEYVNRFKVPETTIFAVPFPSGGEFNSLFRAHIDYHDGFEPNAKGKPGRNEHIVSYGLLFDDDFKRWSEISGREVSQVSFARFVEEMLHTIAEPDGATLLEMAQELQIHRGVVARNTRRLADNTISIEYTESDETATKAGKFTVPDEIKIAVPVFLNTFPVEIKAKLRYNFNKGEPLTFEIKILNINTIILSQFQELAGDIQAEVGIKPLLSHR